nr:MAG TPA: hypothetical protein [Caudoviricetes sp.]
MCSVFEYHFEYQSFLRRRKHSVYATFKTVRTGIEP